MKSAVSQHKLLFFIQNPSPSLVNKFMETRVAKIGKKKL